MMMEMGRCPSMGRSTTRSTSAPTAAAPRAATTRAAAKGSPSTVMAVQPKKAPSIISSPVAKLMTPVAL